MSHIANSKAENLISEIIARRQPPISDAPVKVVINDVGSSPKTVAQTMRETLNLTVTDTDALAEAMPLILFENLDRRTAEIIQWRFQLAGASMQLSEPRSSKLGINRYFFGRR